MTDLSYTNKDGLNPAAGFTNVYNYHRDAASGSAGYAHGGYPEVTGETSPYKDTSYKTGDKTDFFDNGNTFDIIGGDTPPEGRKAVINLIYKKAAQVSCPSPELTDSVDVIIWEHYDEDNPSEGTTYSNLSYIDCSNDANFKFLGNTSLIANWGFSTNEEPDTSCPFCIIKQNYYGEWTGNDIILDDSFAVRDYDEHDHFRVVTRYNSIEDYSSSNTWWIAGYNKEIGEPYGSVISQEDFNNFSEHADLGDSVYITKNSEKYEVPITKDGGGDIYFDIDEYNQAYFTLDDYDNYRFSGSFSVEPTTTYDEECVITLDLDNFISNDDGDTE